MLPFQWRIILYCIYNAHISAVCMAAVRVPAWSGVLMLFNNNGKKGCWENAHELVHTHTHTLSSWVCRVSLFLPGKGLSENLRGRQEGTRWRPLQIWLLLTVLWSAHVYRLSQHWYLGLCGAWDAGPGLFEVKLIPQTTLLVIAPSLFSLSSLTPHSPLSRPPFLLSFVFSLSLRWDVKRCRWGALYASSGLCADLNQIE